MPYKEGKRWRATPQFKGLRLKTKLFPTKKEALLYEHQEKEKTKTGIKKLTDIPGIGPSIVKKFEKAGIKSLEEVYKMNIKELSLIEGIGDKTAENILKKLGKLIEEVS